MRRCSIRLVLTSANYGSLNKRRQVPTTRKAGTRWMQPTTKYFIVPNAERAIAHFIKFIPSPLRATFIASNAKPKSTLGAECGTMSNGSAYQTGSFKASRGFIQVRSRLVHANRVWGSRGSQRVSPVHGHHAARQHMRPTRPSRVKYIFTSLGIRSGVSQITLARPLEISAT